MEVTVAWIAVAGLCMIVVLLDAFGAVHAAQDGRDYSFGSFAVLPPSLVLLGVLSLIGGDDSWMFNTLLGIALLVAGPVAVAVLWALSRRTVKAE